MPGSFSPRRRLAAVLMVCALPGATAVACTHGPPGHWPPTTTSSSTTTTVGGFELEGTSWVLIPSSLMAPLPEGREITAGFAAGRITGSAGCNSYDGEAVETGSPLQPFVVEGLRWTEMACEPPELMAAEQEYLTRLGHVYQYYFEGDELRLGTSGGPLRFRPVGR